MAVKKHIFCLIIFCILCVDVFPKFHPRIKWQKITDDKFTVIFARGYEEEAFYTLEAAGDIYRKLAELWGLEVRGKIRILLSDVYDEANGSATFLPFNLIELYLFNPPPDSTIGSYRQWLHQVLSHEMTHIFNLNAGSGLTFFLRKILGANPLLYPMSYAPVWLVEGLAVYGESSLNDWSRLNTPDFDLMLKHIVAGGKARRWPYLFGDSTPWPGPSARYLYGSKFIQFVVQKYGAEKIPEWVREATYYPVPLATAVGSEVGQGKRGENIILLTVRNRFIRTFRADLHRLWDEFIRSIDAGDAVKLDAPANPVAPVTDSGMFKKYPLAAGDGRIFYVNRDYRAFPGIYELRLPGRKSRRLLKKAGISGLYLAAEEQKIYFSAQEYYQSFHLFSDLYAFDLKENRVERLTRGRRLFYPVKIGEHIFCIKREKSRSYLTVFDLKSRQERVISEGFSGLCYMAVSPDQKHIAVSLKQKNRNWSIGLFSMEGKLRRIFSLNDKKLYYPLWKSVDALYLIAEYENHYRLALLDLRSASCRVYHDSRTPSLKFFTPLPEQDKIAASFFSANGYNLGIMDLKELESRQIELKSEEAGDAEKEENGPAPTPEKPEPQITAYRSLADLAPRYVTPTYRYAGSEIQPGLYVSGSDVLARHAFTLAGYYGPVSRTANFDFTYTFDGWLPTIEFRYSDLWDRSRSAGQGYYRHNSRKFEIARLFPLLSRIKRRLYWYTDIHFERQRDEYEDAGESFQADLNGIGLALFYGSARRYYDAISYADGFNLSLCFAREFKFLGSDYNINTASLEYKHYISLFRPNVLALRFAAADSWGQARRRFYMGGAESHDGFYTAGSEPFDLMRGYPSGYFSGTGGYLFNLEYRISLFKFEKVFLVLRSVERFYLSIFTDIGNLWGIPGRGKKIDPAFSFGLELNMIAYVGDEKMNLSAGAALGTNPHHKAVFYVRLGTSF